MKELHKFCNKLHVDFKDISNNLFTYNPGLSLERVPLITICQSIATLMTELAKLRADIIERNKDENSF